MRHEFRVSRGSRTNGCDTNGVSVTKCYNKHCARYKTYQDTLQCNALYDHFDLLRSLPRFALSETS